jgi:hypothetical protein
MRAPPTPPTSNSGDNNRKLWKRSAHWQSTPERDASQTACGVEPKIITRKFGFGVARRNDCAESNRKRRLSILESLPEGHLTKGPFTFDTNRDTIGGRVSHARSQDCQKNKESLRFQR